MIPTSQAARLFRLMSWNLGDLELTGPGDLRDDPRVRHIREVAPDVLCCQKLSAEHDPGRVDAGFERLAEALGMTGRLGRAHGDRLHVGLLWSGSAEEVGTAVALGARMHRNAVLVALRTSGGHRLVVGAIHLPSSSVEHRLEDVGTILAALQATGPTVLAGDWNAVGEDPAYDPDLPEHAFDRRVPWLLRESGLTDAAAHLHAASTTCRCTAPFTSTWTWGRRATCRPPSLRAGSRS